MSQVKLDLRNKTVEQKLTLSQAVLTGSTNNPNLSDANPATAVALAARRYDLAVALANATALRGQAEAATAALEAADEAHDRALTKHGGWVELDTDGDAVKITSVNLGTKDTNTAPIVLTAPQRYGVTLGDEEGELLVNWDNVPGAHGYQTFYTTDLTGATGWSAAVPSSKSYLELQGLTPGTLYLLRSRAVGALGEGPWSVSVQRRAP